MHDQNEKGDGACHVYELEANTPVEGILSLDRRWIPILDVKISERRIYYDPRQFDKTFRK